MLKWRRIPGLIYYPPPTPTGPHISSSLAVCLWSCRCHSPFSLSPPLPPLFSRVKHHYIITQGWIIVMVVVCVCVRLARDWGELGVAEVEIMDKGKKAALLNGFGATIKGEYHGLVKR